MRNLPGSFLGSSRGGGGGGVALGEVGTGAFLIIFVDLWNNYNYNYGHTLIHFNHKNSPSWMTFLYMNIVLNKAARPWVQ